MSRQQESYRVATNKNAADSVKPKKGTKKANKQQDLEELKKEVEFVSGHF
jgi:hypothetical protein